jgi:hypothetical protein
MNRLKSKVISFNRFLVGNQFVIDYNGLIQILID